MATGNMPSTGGSQTGSGETWANPGNVIASDNSYASVTLSFTSARSAKRRKMALSDVMGTGGIR